MDAEASAAELEAAAPDRPEWIARHDGDETYAWARVAWDVAAAEPGAWFDHALADAVIADWPNWATLTLDRFAGVPFMLAPNQEIIVRLLVGWMKPVELLDPLTRLPTIVHIRLFRRLLLWIPRKNGKSEFLAALALLFFVLDGVAQGEGYVFARKEAQARIVFNRMAAMVANSPDLKADILPFHKSLYLKPLAAKFEVLTGSPEGLHGKSPTVIVGDEMHEWRSTVIADTLRQGTGGRLQPIELYASTAGVKSGGHTAGEQLYEETRAIIERRRADPTTLACVFEAAETDDPGDPATWRKANPNLGLSPTEHYLKGEYAKCEGNPRALAAFKCYHLGVWAEQVSKWLPLKKWDACAPDKQAWKAYPERLKRRKCRVAFDISSTTDITARVALFEPTEDDPVQRLMCRFWVPADNVEARVAEGAPLDKFIALGALETTEGDYVDQNALGADLVELDRDYDVQMIGFDPWNAAKLYGDLTKGDVVFDGAPAIAASKFREMRQGIRTLGEPSKQFEKLVFSGQLDHGGHPVLRWMAGNAVVVFDRNLNFMPAKDRSPDKIDGIVSGVMAVGLSIAPVETEERSYLETADVMVI